MVEEGNFRQDLLYRINTIEIAIPPLRERGEDVLLLADYFLQRYTHKYKKEINGLNREAKQKLMRYHWPGNVRELQHAIERAIILSDSPLLKPANFMLQPQPEKRVNTDEILNLEQLERNAIERAMKRSEGNLSRAAEYLGITRYALYRKLEKLVYESFTNFTDDSLYVTDGGSSYSCISVLSTFTLFLLVIFADDYGKYYHLYLSVAI